jgi:thiosulfate/3-mercaptopyruvate sulfurtransferase
MNVFTLVAFAGILALITGCASGPSSGTPTAPATAGPVARDVILEPEQLTGLIAGVVPPKEPIVILDVRPADKFEAKRLVGAVRVDMDDWNQLARSPGGAMDAPAWTGKIRALGLSGFENVLIYDDGAMTRAAAVWFLLHDSGYDRARVINGGLPEIEKAVPGNLLTSGPGTTPAPGTFIAKPGTGTLVRWADRQEVKAALNDRGRQIFDARTIREYTGEDTRDNARSGRLPGAVNVPHTTLMDERNRVRPAADLRAMLTAAGFEQGKVLVTHCQGGGRSSLAAIAALRAGFVPVDNYYLSFGDWQSDESCPLVK